MFGWNGLPVWSLRDTPGSALIMPSTKLGATFWSKSAAGAVRTFAGILSRSRSEPGIGVIPTTSIVGKVTVACAHADASIDARAPTLDVSATMIPFRSTTAPHETIFRHGASTDLLAILTGKLWQCQQMR